MGEQRVTKRLVAALAALVTGVGIISGIGPSPAGAAAADVMINEIHFHPTCDVSYSPCPDGPREFIEIHNNSADVVDLSGWRFSDGVTFTFPAGSTIQPWGHTVIADSASGFAARWGFTPYEWDGRLSNSGETITLVDGAGTVRDTVTYADGTETAGEWSVVTDGDGRSLQLITVDGDNARSVVWQGADPTPGAKNPAQDQGPTPAVANLQWTVLPNADQDIEVTADVFASSDVVLEYRVNYPGTTRSVTMTSADGSSYRATIPAADYGPGDLVRLRVVLGGTARAPRADDTIDWVGTTVADPSVDTDLPYLQWFTSTANYNAGYNEQGSRLYDGVLAYDGIVYDNVGFRIRGSIARTSAWTKRNWKFKTPDHHTIQIGDFSYAVDTMDLQGGFADEARIREYLGHVMADGMGLVASEVQHIRVDLNGSFFGLHTMQEHPDADFMKENGLDNATLHQGARSSSYEREGGPNRAPQWSLNYENWDIPEFINLVAAGSVIQHNDFGHSNFFWWYDEDEHGRFEGMIWDLDLSQGIRYAPTDGLTTRLENNGARSYVWWRWQNQTAFLDDALDDPILRQMYLRRLRTLADEWYGTGRLETLAREAYARIDREWRADTQRWGFWGRGNYSQQGAIDRYADTWIDAHYAHILGGGPDGDIPGPQPANPSMTLTVEPAPGDQRTEHIRITNNESTAIDLSNWTISGSTALELPPGSVIPANRSAYVVGNDRPEGFRAATSNLHVLGQYGNELPDLNGSVALAQADGTPVASADWGQVQPPSVILNEWNAVASDTVIEETDPFFGPVAGNGGDWFELVVVADNVDLRGFQLELTDSDNGGGVPEVTDTFVLADDPLLASVRSGTIITVAEDVPDDASYDPAGGDWTINLQSNSDDAGRFITPGSQSNFDTNNDDWHLRILDPAGQPVFGPAGEGVNGVGGVSSSETGELEAHPSAGIALSDYGDSRGSTFSAPNIFGGVTQDFGPLRSVVPPGDATIGDSVSYSAGGGAAGVAIDLFAADAEGNRAEWLRSTTSDDTGTYSFSVDAGCYAVVFIAPDGQNFLDGSQYDEQALCLDPGETNDTIDAVLDNGGPNRATIGDNVSYSAGGGAAGVAIDLYPANGDGSRGPWLRATTTDDTGTYSFGVDAGCYIVVFIAPDGQNFLDGSQYDEQALCLDPGETNNTIDAVLDNGGADPATIGDSVSYSAGGGAAGVAIDLFAADAEGNRAEWLRSTTSDDTGTYSFSVDAGCYAVVFIAPDGQNFLDGSQYDEQALCLDPGETNDTIDAVLDNGGPNRATIGDNVSYSAGGGAAGVAIDLYPANGDGSRGPWLRATTTDDTGTYSFGVDAGCYIVVFIAPDGQNFLDGSPYDEQALCLDPGETNNTIDATLS